MAHTPGPWAIDPSARIDDKYTWVFGTDGSPVAGTSGRVRIDDAYLIAAAPDLLEACKELVFKGSWSTEDPQTKRALAAIAKAEGR